MTCQRRHAICSTLGGECLIENEHKPVSLRSDTVGSLNACEDRGGCIIKNAKTHFSSGDQLRPRGSLLPGSSVLFEGKPGRDRVAVLIALAGRHVRIVVDTGAMATE